MAFRHPQRRRSTLTAKRVALQHQDQSPQSPLKMDAFETRTTRDRSTSRTDIGHEHGSRREGMNFLPNVPQAVLTKGLFPMMDLPTELRLKIYPYLLISDGEIAVNKCDISVSNRVSSPPSVAILQTCKRINEEGTKILYSQNKFIIYLSIDPKPSFSLTNSFILKSLRWSSISFLTSLSFVSNSHPLPGLDDSVSETARSQSAFHCTGADIIARFKPNDFRYSPKGPDEYMSLSVSNWISTQLMKVLLASFQQELEALSRRPREMLAVGAMDDTENQSADGNDGGQDE